MPDEAIGAGCGEREKSARMKTRPASAVAMSRNPTREAILIP
jgi:hypothetical protein